MRVVVVGADEVGRSLARFFSSRGDDAVLLDAEASAITEAEEGLDVLTLVGNPLHRAVLEMTRPAEAGVFYVTTGSDATNLAVGAMAHAMGARRVIARVDDAAFFRGVSGIERGVLGIDAVMCPARLQSNELLRQIRALEVPWVGDFAEFAVQVVLCPVSAQSKWIDGPATGVKLADGCSVRGVVRDGFLRPVHEIPSLTDHDLILLAGPSAGIPDALRKLGHISRLNRVVVVGGGSSGRQLCEQLGSSGARLQLLESNRAVAVDLSERLPGVHVIHADGTNLDTLRDLQIETAQVVVAVTQTDEVNLMVALVSRQLGVPHTLTVVHRPGYSDIYQHLGIDGVVSRHEVTARMMATAAVADRAQSAGHLPGTQHAVVEFVVPEGGPTAMGQIAVPSHALLVAHCRGQEIVQGPLEPGDVLVFAVLPRSIPKLAAAVAGARR